MRVPLDCPQNKQHESNLNISPGRGAVRIFPPFPVIQLFGHHSEKKREKEYRGNWKTDEDNPPYYRHKAIIAYLASNNLPNAANALRDELNLTDTFDSNTSKKYEGLLEKKWTSVVRLQKKVCYIKIRYTSITYPPYIPPIPPFPAFLFPSIRIYLFPSHLHLHRLSTFYPTNLFPFLPSRHSYFVGQGLFANMSPLRMVR